MPSLENKWYRRMLFLFVYFIQSFVSIITLSLFPLLFSDIGIDPLYYGVAGSISLLPIVFKAFIGPLNDNFPIPFLRGRRRGYIIIGALLNIAFLPFLALNPITFAVLFFVIWFFQTLGIAIMDILTDALAVGGTTAIQNIRGRTGASAWMYVGVTIGGIFGTIFAFPFEGHVMDSVFDSTVFSTMLFVTIISIVPLILIIFLKEPSEEIKEAQSFGEIIRRNLRYPFVKWGLVFAFLLNIDGGLLELTLEPFLNDVFSGTYLQILGSLLLISLIGAIPAALGYFFIDKIKKNRLLMIIAAIYAVFTAIIAMVLFAGLLNFSSFLFLYGIMAAVSGISYVTFIALFFDLSDPKAAGTMIAMFLAVMNLGMIIGIAFGGVLWKFAGISVAIQIILVISAVISAIRIYPLSRINMEDIEKTFYQKED